MAGHKAGRSLIAIFVGFLSLQLSTLHWVQQVRPHSPLPSEVFKLHSLGIHYYVISALQSSPVHETEQQFPMPASSDGVAYLHGEIAL